MPSRTSVIAEAVKVRLNTAPNGTFNATFTAVRIFVPLAKFLELEEDGIRVTVLAAADDQTLVSRIDKRHEIEIHVGIEQRISASCNPETETGAAELDGYALLAEQIADYLSNPGQLGSTSSVWLRTKHTLTYDIGSLIEKRVFMSFITVTYLT